jgi:hypothetical protein
MSSPITFEEFGELVALLRDDPAHPVARNIDDLLKAAQDLADTMDAAAAAPAQAFTPAELQAMLDKLGHLTEHAPAAPPAAGLPKLLPAP